MTPLLTLIVPTIDGREPLLERTMESLATAVRADFESAEVQVVIPENYPTIGEAWNAGMEDAEGEYVWLGADDVIVPPASFAAAREWADKQRWPSPRIVNMDGTLHSCGTLGQGALMEECETGTRCYASPFPFFARSYWKLIGPCLPIHYYADDYLSWRASSIGISSLVSREYVLTHLEGVAGRAQVAARAFQDKDAFMAAVCA